MAENTEISWCDRTWSPWEGCQKVGPGCDHCYAESMNKWLRKGENWGPGAPRRIYSDEHWEKPLKWSAALAKQGLRETVFPSVCDPFDNAAPEGQFVRFLDVIRRCENLNFLLLTKRIGNVTPMLREVAAILRSEHGSQAERTAGAPAGAGRRAGNRSGGADLASEEAEVRPLDRSHEGDAMQARESRTADAGGVSAGAGDDRRQEALRGSGAAGVASLQGTDPAGTDGQPPGRHQAPQSPAQPGAGDVQRAADTCDPAVGSPSPRRAGLEASEGAGGRSQGAGNAPAPRPEGAGEDDRGAIRGDTEGCVVHLSRRDLEARAALLAWVEDWLAGRPPANVWLGATVVNQEEADRDIPKLLAVPARVRFLSMEPLLGPVDLTGFLKANPDGLRRAATCSVGIECRHGYDVCPICDGNPRTVIDWVIGGFESGPQARPGNPDHARSLRNQCAAAGVPFHWKQNGEWAPGSIFSDAEGIPSGTYCDFDGLLTTDDERVWKVGKKAAGRLLDGVTHDAFPEAP